MNLLNIKVMIWNNICIKFIHLFSYCVFKVIFVVVVYFCIINSTVYDCKISSKIQRLYLFKDRIAYTRQNFIRCLSPYVKSCYWFPVMVLKISHYLRLNYLWQVVYEILYYRIIFVVLLIKNTLLLAICWILQKNILSCFYH